MSVCTPVGNGQSQARHQKHTKMSVVTERKVRAGSAVVRVPLGHGVLGAGSREVLGR